MTPKERANSVVERLDKVPVRRRPALIEAAIRAAANEVIGRISERRESESDPLTPASAAAMARELMHILFRPGCLCAGPTQKGGPLGLLKGAISSERISWLAKLTPTSSIIA
jgi:hypothetical protein